jgi:hypothetical protein
VVTVGESPTALEVRPTAQKFFWLTPEGTAQTAVMVAADNRLHVKARKTLLSELKLRPPEKRDSLREPLWRILTKLGGAFDLDCGAVDQDFGYALHQLV